LVHRSAKSQIFRKFQKPHFWKILPNPHTASIRRTIVHHNSLKRAAFLSSQTFQTLLQIFHSVEIRYHYRHFFHIVSSSASLSQEASESNCTLSETDFYYNRDLPLLISSANGCAYTRSPSGIFSPSAYHLPLHGS